MTRDQALQFAQAATVVAWDKLTALFGSGCGERPVKKDVTADAIGEACGLSEGEVDSLTKANKTALVKILNTLTKE